MSYLGELFPLVEENLLRKYQFNQKEKTDNYVLFEHNFSTTKLYEPTKIQIYYNSDFLCIDVFMRLPNSEHEVSEVSLGLFSGYLIHSDFFHELMESLNILYWVENNGQGLYSYYCRSLGVNDDLTPMTVEEYKATIQSMID